MFQFGGASPPVATGLLWMFMQVNLCISLQVWVACTAAKTVFFVIVTCQRAKAGGEGT